MAKAKTSTVQLVKPVDFGEYQGQGLENVDGEHLKIPFLNILQGLSDEVKTENPKYIEGAVPGLFINSVTKEIYGTEVTIIPATVDHCYIEWVPRNRGGGFRGRFDKNSEEVRRAKTESKDSFTLRVKRTTEDGDTVHNDLVETFYIAGVLVLDDGDRLEPFILSATKTKIPLYKEWITRINMFTVVGPNGAKQTPPLFAHRTKLTSFPDTKKGFEFSNLKIEAAVDGSLEKSLITDFEDPLFLTGYKTRKELGSGTLEVDFSTQQEEVAAKDEEDF